MSSNIIQWNCRGLKANYNEILLLISKYNPSLVCLSETFPKESDRISFKNYSMYNYIDNNQSKASGGTLIIINNNCPHRQIALELLFNRLQSMLPCIDLSLFVQFIYLQNQKLHLKTLIILLNSFHAIFSSGRFKRSSRILRLF